MDELVDGLLYRLLLVLCLVGATSSQTTMHPRDLPGIDLMFFDKFGDDSTLAYSGGYALLTCHKPRNAPRCTGSEILALLAPNGSELMSNSCSVPLDDAIFRLNMTKDTSFGTYRCKWNNKLVSHDVHDIAIEYRICDDREQLCIDDDKCQPGNTACVVVMDGDKRKELTCDKIPNKSVCRHSDSLLIGICPAKEKSLCGAFSTDYSLAWAQMETKLCTRDQAEVPQIYYGNKPFLFAEPIQLTENERKLQVRFKNQRLVNRELTCITKNDGGVEINREKLTTSEVTDVALIETIFESGSKLYKIQCIFDFDPGDKQKIKVVNTLVSFGGKLDVTGKQDANGAYVGELMCALHPTPTDDFKFSYSWTQASNQLETSGPTLKVTQSDQYTCHTKVTYKSCTPRRTFKFEITSATVSASPAETSTSTTSTVEVASTSTAATTTPEATSSSPAGTTTPNGNGTPSAITSVTSGVSTAATNPTDITLALTSASRAATSATGRDVISKPTIFSDLAIYTSTNGATTSVSSFLGSSPTQGPTATADRPSPTKASQESSSEGTSSESTATVASTALTRGHVITVAIGGVVADIMFG